LAPGSFESVSDYDVGVLVSMVLTAFAVDYYFLARYQEVDTHVEQVTLMLVAVKLLNDDPATDHAVVETLEYLDLVANLGPQGVGWLHIAPGNL